MLLKVRKSVLKCCFSLHIAEHQGRLHSSCQSHVARTTINVCRLPRKARTSHSLVYSPWIHLSSSILLCPFSFPASIHDCVSIFICEPPLSLRIQCTTWTTSLEVLTESLFGITTPVASRTDFLLESRILFASGLKSD